MTTKNRKQIVESVKTHNQVFVKNLLLEKAKTTFLGGLQSIADITALGTGLAGGALMFVPGLQPVGAGLMAISRGAGLAGGGLAFARTSDRYFNPDSGEVAPVGDLMLQTVLGLGGGWAASTAAKNAIGVDKQIKNVVAFRNARAGKELAAQTRRAHAFQRAAAHPTGSMYNRYWNNIYQEQDQLAKNLKPMGGLPGDPRRGLAPSDPGYLASQQAATGRGGFGLKNATHWLTGSPQLDDLEVINKYVAAGGVPKGGEYLKRGARVVGIPTAVNLMRPQGAIGSAVEDDSNLDSSVIGRLAQGPGGFRSPLKKRLSLRPHPGMLSAAELGQMPNPYPTETLLSQILNTSANLSVAGLQLR